MRRQRSAESTTAERLFLVLMGGGCLGPPATNVGPAPWSYASWAVLGGALLWVIWPERSRRIRGMIPALASGLFGWALVSLVWTESSDRAGAGAALLLMAGAAALPWAAVSHAAAREGGPTQLLRRLCAVVVLASSASAVLALVFTDFHPILDRLALPLGGASNSGWPLILCLAVLLDAYGMTRRPWWIWPIVLDIGLIALTGSRYAAVIAVVVLCSAWLRSPVGPPRWLLAVACAAVVGALAVIRGTVSPADGSRWRVAVRALRGWSQAAPEVLFGTGAGEVWPWLALELDRIDRIPGTTAWDSPYGVLFYHPHSVYVGTAVELGAVGAVILGALLISVLRAASLSRTKGMGYLALAMWMSLIAFSVEYYLFRNVPGSILWWSACWVLVAKNPGQQSVGARRSPMLGLSASRSKGGVVAQSPTRSVLVLSLVPWRYATRTRKGATAYSRAGLDVEFLAMQEVGRTGKRDLSGSRNEGAVRVVHVPLRTPSTPGTARAQLTNVVRSYGPAFARMVRQVLTQPTDVVHVTGASLVPLALIHHFRHGSRLVVDVNERPASVTATGSLFAKVALVERQLISLAGRRASVVTVVAPGHARELAEHHGVGGALVVRNAPLSSWRFGWVDPPEAPPLKVVTVGSLFPGRALEMLVRAVAQVNRQGCNVQLRIVGQGAAEYVSSLEDLIRREKAGDHVLLDPPVGSDAVSQTYTTGHIGLALYEAKDPGNDSLSNKIIETVASGRPVLAGALPENSAFVNELGVGWLTDVDEQSIAEALASLSQLEPAEVERLARHCESVASEQLTWEHEFGKVLAALGIGNDRRTDSGPG